ncbi:MAG: STAS domain-containing protein [Pseudonocardiaceae bacterium]
MNESPDIGQSVTKPSLNVTVSDIASDISLCVLLDDIDLLTAPLLREKLAQAIGVTPRHLVMDLSKVQFLASIGLRLLIDLGATQQATGHQLVLVVGNNRAVTRPLQITGLDQYFDLHVELTTAINACHAAKIDREPSMDLIEVYETSMKDTRKK